MALPRSRSPKLRRQIPRVAVPLLILAGLPDDLLLVLGGRPPLLVEPGLDLLVGRRGVERPARGRRGPVRRRNGTGDPFRQCNGQRRGPCLRQRRRPTLRDLKPFRLQFRQNLAILGLAPRADDAEQLVVAPQELLVVAPPNRVRDADRNRRDSEIAECTPAARKGLLDRSPLIFDRRFRIDQRADRRELDGNARAASRRPPRGG